MAEFEVAKRMSRTARTLLVVGVGSLVVVGAPLGLSSCSGATSLVCTPSDAGRDAAPVCVTVQGGGHGGW
jgi:hypothetical protein